MKSAAQFLFIWDSREKSKRGGKREMEGEEVTFDGKGLTREINYDL